MKNSTQWPNEDEREDFEIEEFIVHYARLPGNRELEIVGKRERPDYIVKNINTGKEYGVELTSVHLSDRSIPDEHIPTLVDGDGPEIDFNRGGIEQYQERVAKTVRDKVNDVRKNYDLSRPLILSIHTTEYRRLFMNREDWEVAVTECETLFDDISPFIEVVFWSLANDAMFSVTPD